MCVGTCALWASECLEAAERGLMVSARERGGKYF